jgi:hypothetical protein
MSLALDAQGACTVGGWTWSTNFPTTPGAFATTHSGGLHDAWVARLSPTGASLVYSTFLGGTQWDQVNALAVDAQGACTVTGVTTSGDFPTTPGAFDLSYNGAMDAFVARLSPSGSSLVYSTFVGGAANDEAIALALDARGAVTIAGDTMSPDFPTTPGAFDTSYNGGSQFDGDAIVTRLSPTGASLVYSTFLGGTNADSAVVVVLDAQGAATVAGPTESTDFPTTPGAFDTTHNGNRDGFITHLDMLPTGVGAYGNSSPGCNGPLSSSVNSMPRVGNAGFALTCGNAAPNSVGLIAITDRRLLPPVTVLGVQVWVDPSVLFVTGTVFSNSIGASEVPLPIPSNPTVAGLQFFAQFVWLGPSAPPPCPVQGFSASNALDFTIQP